MPPGIDNDILERSARGGGVGGGSRVSWACWRFVGVDKVEWGLRRMVVSGRGFGPGFGRGRWRKVERRWRDIVKGKVFVDCGSLW